MPPYPRKLINEGETVVLDLKPHWWFFWRHILVGSGLVVLFIIWAGLPSGWSWLGWPLALAIFVWAAWVVYRYCVWTYTHFVLTDKRVISRSGIISKRGTEIPLERINNIDFHQGLVDRVLGAGDLDIESAGRD
ncbi:MAG TPA: PH domain-containing protein, partial [Acidimicrobiia bacterium]